MFRGATRGDMNRITEIYARARTAMAAEGNSCQWGDSYPSRELVEQDILTNRLFLYVVNGRIEAVFAFVMGEEPTYAHLEDGAWLDAVRPYATLHRLASAGLSHGVAARVLAWCLERCESLRADTHADNKIMQHVLESNGFTRCGIIHVADGSPRIAYQKLGPATPRLGA